MGGASARPRGLRAEQHVVEYLERLGLPIVGRNVRVGAWELDIVALDGPCVVIVEVRFRDPSSWTSAFGSVDGRKRRYLTKAGRRLWRRRFRRVPWLERLRFDVAKVSYDPSGKPHIEYCRAAF